MSTRPQLDLDQLRKQAKELVRARRAGGEPLKLSAAQLELAREHGFASWPKLKAYLERLGAEQPFETDPDYYEGRADGIATTSGVTRAEARLDLARRHGFPSWASLRRHVTALQEGTEPPGPFMLAFQALQAGDKARLVELLDAHPELIEARGTNGNDLLGLAGFELVPLLLERGADPNRGNDYGWTKLHQAGYSNRPALAELMLAAGGRARPLGPRGRRHAARRSALLGPQEGGAAARARTGEPAGRRRARASRTDPRARGNAGRGSPSRLLPPPRRLSGLAALRRSAGGARRGARLGSQERTHRGARAPTRLGARVDADPYQGTALVWAAAKGRIDAIRKLVELGPIPTGVGSFGGPDHGRGITALHLAAQSGKADAVEVLLELGADPSIRDELHGGDPAGWAEFGGHAELAERLRAG